MITRDAAISAAGAMANQKARGHGKAITAARANEVVEWPDGKPW